MERVFRWIKSTLLCARESGKRGLPTCARGKRETDGTVKFLTLLYVFAGGKSCVNVKTVADVNEV